MTLARAIAVLIVLFGLPTLASAVTLTDDTFAPADWSIVTAGDGVVTGVQALSGGNPDEFRHVVNRPDVNLFVAGFHTNSTFVYDPSVQGAIQSIDWSIDYNNIQSGQHVSLFLEQAGVRYVAGSSGLTTTGAGIGVWAAHSTTALIESDFGTPDFSVSGAPITFGFRTASSYDPAAGDINNTVGYDNLTITIVSIPTVPGLSTLGWALLVITMCITAARARFAVC